MKSVALCAVALLGLAACDDAAGGSGGAGGIQTPESTVGASTTTTGTPGASTSTSGPGGGGNGGSGVGGMGDATSTSSTGNPPDCGSVGPADFGLCDAVVACDPDTEDQCLLKMLDERCQDGFCADEHDAWSECVEAIADDGGWDTCPARPQGCEPERHTYDACILGNGPCTIGADADAVADLAEECAPGSGGELRTALQQQRCEDVSCADEHDAWLLCTLDVADSGDWDECPLPPAQCGAEEYAWLRCVRGICGPGPGGVAICAALSDCDGTPGDDCLAQQEAERCALEPGSACRDAFDAYSACAGAVAASGEWDECPIVADACDDLFLAYSSCDEDA